MIRESASTGFVKRPSGCQPGTARLQQYLMSKFGLANSGCFNANSRLSNGGLSWHAYGKALDMGANWYNTSERLRADQLFDWILAHKEEINLQQMIWANKIWDIRDGSTRPYRRSDHYNHVHIAIGYQASQTWKPGITTLPVIPEENDMVEHYITATANSPWYFYNGSVAFFVDGAEAQLMIDLGLVKKNNEQVKVIGASALNKILARCEIK